MSYAFLEVGQLAVALIVADRCVKTSDVHLFAIENTDSGALCLKLSGPAAAVKLAADVGVGAARRMGAECHVAVIPGPDPGVEAVVRAKPNYSPLLGIYDALLPRGAAMETREALGLLETQGLVANLHATDVMLKTSGVRVLGKEKIGAGFVTIMIRGDLAAVQAAIDAGRRSVEQLGGKLILADVISNPHPDLSALLPA